MPSKTKKYQATYRAGVTVPDEVVDAMKAYMEENGLSFSEFVNRIWAENQSMKAAGAEAGDAAIAPTQPPARPQETSPAPAIELDLSPIQDRIEEVLSRLDASDEAIAAMIDTAVSDIKHAIDSIEIPEPQPAVIYQTEPQVPAAQDAPSDVVPARSSEDDKSAGQGQEDGFPAIEVPMTVEEDEEVVGAIEGDADEEEVPGLFGGRLDSAGAHDFLSALASELAGDDDEDDVIDTLASAAATGHRSAKPRISYEVVSEDLAFAENPVSLAPAVDDDDEECIIDSIMQTVDDDDGEDGYDFSGLSDEAWDGLSALLPR